MRIQRTRRGARLLHGEHVVSELPARPGPTDSVFDVLAACVRALAPSDGRVAMLGFAAGGTVAPLRALGCTGPIAAVDLDVSAVPTFREVAGGWAGAVTIDEADAAAWLRKERGKFAAIIEDLSLQVPGDVTKPPVSWEVLPALIAKKVAKEGVAVVNVLPVPGMAWKTLLSAIAAPFADARVVHLEEFDNRILVAGRALPPARRLAARMDDLLGVLASTQHRSVSVRTLR